MCSICRSCIHCRITHCIHGSFNDTNCKSPLKDEDYRLFRNGNSWNPLQNSGDLFFFYCNSVVDIHVCVYGWMDGCTVYLYLCGSSDTNSSWVPKHHRPAAAKAPTRLSGFVGSLTATEWGCHRSRFWKRLHLWTYQSHISMCTYAYLRVFWYKFG